MRTRHIFAIFLLLFVFTGAAYGSRATDILSKAAVCEREVSYRGVKTATLIFDDRRVTTVYKVVHKSPDKTYTQYFSPSALSGIIIIENGPNFWRYRPVEQVWEGLGSSPIPENESVPDELFENFEIMLTGSELIAGRNTHVLTATPKGKSDHKRKLWIDQDVNLVVKLEESDENGHVIKRSVFTSLEIEPRDIPTSLFAVKGKIKEVPIPAAEDFEAVVPTYLPHGYKYKDTSKIILDSRHCIHFQYSNGMSSLSLFQRKTSEPDMPPKKVKCKTTNMMTWRSDGVDFTLVGSISHAEMKKIARSTIYHED